MGLQALIVRQIADLLKERRGHDYAMLQLILLSPTLALAVDYNRTSLQSSIRIVRAQEAGERQWLSSRLRTERIIIDEQGRRLLLRVIEFE